MNRTDFQRLAEERLRDAAALLAARQWSGAYYLAGYAVECGLKACIAKMTKAEDFPDKKHAEKCFTHDLTALITVAGLAFERKSDFEANEKLNDNWLIVKDWNEQARYEIISESDAIEFVAAINDSYDGVMKWITDRW